MHISQETMLEEGFEYISLIHFIGYISLHNTLHTGNVIISKFSYYIIINKKHENHLT